MKKLMLIILVVILSVTLVAVGACKKDDNVTTNKSVSVLQGPQGKVVEIADVDVADFNYASLFTISVDGKSIAVENSFLDLSAVSAFSDSFNVTCTYEKTSATVKVNVIKTVSLVLDCEEVTVYSAFVNSYDFNAHFTLTVDGKAKAIDNSMVTTNVTAVAGTYFYNVSYVSAKATLTVKVSDSRAVSVIPSYALLPLTLAELADYDYTMLFSVYVDGEAVEVTKEMLDISALTSAALGETYTVTCNYVDGNDKGSASTQIKIVEEAQIKVTTKNLQTYPNGEYIELTSLFEVKKGDVIIPVTNEMISGTIDYSREGDNIIVLNFNNEQYQAIVTVTRGVVIRLPKGDTVNIKKGTDINNYLFAEDFIVIVNGARYRNIAQYINTEGVNFNEEGDYEVTLSVPYNENQLNISGAATFQYVEETITYHVVALDYTLTADKEVVQLPLGTEGYKVFSNLTLVRNGLNNILVTNASSVGKYACYAEVVGELDNTSLEPQLVTIKVYVEGFAENDLGTPVEISYWVQYVGDVKITAKDMATFGNETIFTTDLFTITENGKEVPVTYDMVSGKVDTFHAGIYYVTAEYKGVTAVSKVVVLNTSLVGRYYTPMTAIEVPSTDDDDGNPDVGWDPDYGWGDDSDDWGAYSLNSTYALSRASFVGDMVITSDGNITVHGVKAQFVGALDENTIYVTIGGNLHTLYCYNGIVVLDPDNSLRMEFHEQKRPLVYFNSAEWELGDHVVVNYGSNYVLPYTTPTYSIDLFNVTSKHTSQSMWYGLKVRLAEKLSSDWVYVVSWGEVELSDNFAPKTGVQATLTLNDETIKFVMTSDTVGTVDKTEEMIWAGLTLNGTVDGKSAQLIFSSAEGVELRINGKKQFSLTSNDFGNMKNGGIFHSTNTVFVCCYNGEYEGQSYKFIVDAANNTFQTLPKDGAYGLYTDGEIKVFLDGYGTGVIGFDPKSYSVTQFNYTVVNNEVKLTFVNTLPTFKYGDYATFNLADLKNVLTAKYSLDGLLDGRVLTNKYITDGAIVTVNNSVFLSGCTKRDILDSISVVTSAGTLTYEQKDTKGAVYPNIKVVDVSKVDRINAGICQLTVTVSVDGNYVTAYYSVQILPVIADYADSPIVASLSKEDATTGKLVGVKGAIFGNLLCVDKYGRVSLLANGVQYNGYAILNDTANTFVGKVFSQNGAEADISGECVVDGVYSVRCSGAANFTDYYTTGEVSVAGCANNILRRIVSGSNTLYIYAATANSFGEPVTIEPISGDEKLFAVTRSNGTVLTVKITWGNSVNDGLAVADKFRGSYTTTDGGTLVLDGFGKGTLNGNGGTYTIIGAAEITFTTSTTTTTISVSISNGTFQVVEQQK